MAAFHRCPVSEFLLSVHLGPRQAYKCLGIWPLLRGPGGPPGPDYTSLADALEDGFVGVEESGARDPGRSLRVHNRAASAVLVLAGEELGDAQPRRVADASFLVPAGGRARIAVSPAEKPSRPAHPRELAELSAAIRPLDGQVGFVAAVAERVVGLEAIGRSDVFGRVFPSRLRRYAAAALGPAAAARRPGAFGPARFDAPEPFLTGLRAAPRRSGPSRGLGVSLRLRSERVEARALMARGALLHLAAFPIGRPAPSRGSPARRDRGDRR